MEWYEVDWDNRRAIRFPERTIPGHGKERERDEASGERSFSSSDYKGGLLHSNKWSWLTRQHDEEALLMVYSLNDGSCIARHAFNKDFAGEKADLCYSISFVEELFPDKRLHLLAVCLDVWSPQEPRNQAQTQLLIYSISLDRVLRRIDLDGLAVSSLRFLNPEFCLSSYRLLDFAGCLCLGTRCGALLFVDLNIDRVLETAEVDVRLFQGSKQLTIYDTARKKGGAFRTSISLSDPLCSMSEIAYKLDRCREAQKHLCFEVRDENDDSGISSLLGIDLINGLAVGKEDGGIWLFDLYAFEGVHFLNAPTERENEPCSVMAMCYILPPDDPKPCFYLCAMYNYAGALHTLLHVLNFRRSIVDPQTDQILFEEFVGCYKYIRLLMDESACSVLACTTLSTSAFAHDNGTLLTIFSWYSESEQRNKMVFFDVNQWYKDEMPTQMRAGRKPNYMCGYVLSGQQRGLALALEPVSVLHFQAQQRYDEHSYPNTLSFDCSLLTPLALLNYAHEGIQVRFLNTLRRQKSSLFLQPEEWLESILRLRLLPQFCELNVYATFSKAAMYEVILSVALEHNCLRLLMDCARCWVDGSYLRHMRNPTELSLSTMTNWLLTRATQIKGRCVEICQGIFEIGGYPLDDREKKEFKTLSTQLEQIRGLQQEVMLHADGKLVAADLDNFALNEKAIGVASEYHRVLYWLIRHGILPESRDWRLGEDGNEPPFKMIGRVYAARRKQLAELAKDSNWPNEDKNRPLLYIDALLENSAFGTGLREHWDEQKNTQEPRSKVPEHRAGGSRSLYPPESVESILQVMLSPNDDLRQKHQFIMYFLFDLSSYLEHKLGRPSPDYAKQFGESFDISDSTVKALQCFWLLDRGDSWRAVDVLYDVSCNKDRDLLPWQVGVLVEQLLLEKAIKLAVRVVDSPPGPVVPQLRLKVLLANESIPEAFHYCRLYENGSEEEGEGKPSLMEYFFRHCINNSKFKVLAELCLREHEEALVYRLLRQCKSEETECVQLILLLQKTKYIEAVSFMDEVAAEQEKRGSHPIVGDTFHDASNMILSAYRATMAPITQSIAGTYFRIRDNLTSSQQNNASPEPFSCQLTKQNASGTLGGIFQSSALGAHWATQYQSSSSQGFMTSSQNVPFLRNPQYNWNGQPGQANRRRHVKPSIYEPRKKRGREMEPEPERREINDLLQPRKRRRLIDQEVVEDVCNFVKNKFESSPEKAARKASETTLGDILPATATALLEIPAFGTSRQPTHIRRSFMPPSILKQKIAPPSESEAMETSQESFCFVAPQQKTDEGHDEAEGDEQTDEIIVEIDSTVAGELASGDEEESDSEYLSPLASANSSLANASFASIQPRKSLNSSVTPKPAELRTALEPSGAQVSSGFGSFELTQDLQLAPTVSHFVPTVCSSKVCETQSVFTSASQLTEPAKLSECTTVCDSLDNASLWPLPQRWSPPSVRPPLAHSHPPAQPLQQLNTTLGMSTYEMTAEAQPLSSPINTLEYVEESLQLEETQPESLQLEVTQSEPEASPERVTQQPEEEEPSPTNNDEDSRNGLVFEENINILYSDDPLPAVQQSSPSFTLSSGLSDISSETHGIIRMPQIQENPLFSNTDSITNSRSITHTPNSFLPSDTNVSPPSSPSGQREATGEGSPRSMFRANSLETMDDLDTTKGSLEEEEEEDDCVIALDGTEVRGYVPQAAPPTGTSSSAELFAFKDECKEEAQTAVATANSDSVMTDTINLDSSVASSHQGEEEEVELIAEEVVVSSNDSVATVENKPSTGATSEAKPKEQVAQQENVIVLDPSAPEADVVDVDSSVVSQEVVDVDSSVVSQEVVDVDSSVVSQEVVDVDSSVVIQEETLGKDAVKDHDQVEAELNSKGPDLEVVDVDSNAPTLDTVTLVVSDEEEQTASVKRATTRRRVQERGASAPPENMNESRATRRYNLRASSVTPHEDSPRPQAAATRKRRLRSASQQSEDSEANTPTMSTPRSGQAARALRAVSTPPVPVSTPKRSKALINRYMLEIIEENDSLNVSSLARTRARTRLDELANSPASDAGSSKRSQRSASEPLGSTSQAEPRPRTKRRTRRGTEDERPPSRQTDEAKNSEPESEAASESNQEKKVRRSRRRAQSEAKTEAASEELPETSGHALRNRKLRILDYENEKSPSSPTTRKRGRARRTPTPSSP